MSEPTGSETERGIADFKRRLAAAHLNVVQQNPDFRRGYILFAIGDDGNQTDIVLSEEFLDDLPNMKDYQAMVDSYAHAVAGRLRCGSPELFYCQSGVAIQVSFRWPIQSAIYENELMTFLLVDVRNAADGKVAKCSVMLGGGKVFAYVIHAVNSIRMAVDAGQIRFYEPTVHQEVYQRVETKQQPQERSQTDVRHFLAVKAYTGFIAVGETTEVWTADPWDAQYLGVAVRDLSLAMRVLRADGLLQTGTSPDYVRPTDKLLAERSARAKEEAPLSRSRQKLSHASPPAKDELLKDLQHVLKQHATFALIVLDVDNFKSVNDTKGHLGGNACLDKFIAAVETVVGNRGKVYRWGGDEFAICLPDFSTTEALTTGERIRSAVEQAKAGGDIEVTASIGVCGSDSTDSKSPEELFDFADKAMYQSKHNGKNRVSTWPVSPNARPNAAPKRLEEPDESEIEHLVELILQQTQANYVCLVQNDSDFEIKVETIKVARKDAELSATKIQPSQDWTVAAHARKQIIWTPSPDPARTLRMLEPDLAQGTVVPIDIILICRIKGRLRPLKFTKLVSANFGRDTYVTPM